MLNTCAIGTRVELGDVQTFKVMYNTTNLTQNQLPKSQQKKTIQSCISVNVTAYLQFHIDMFLYLIQNCLHDIPVHR